MLLMFGCCAHLYVCIGRKQHKCQYFKEQRAGVSASVQAVGWCKSQFFAGRGGRQGCLAWNYQGNLFFSTLAMCIAAPQPNAWGTPIQRKAGFIEVTVQLCSPIQLLTLRAGLIGYYCSQNWYVLVPCRISTCLSRAGGADLWSAVC